MESDKKYYVFLDMDGVLTSARYQYAASAATKNYPIWALLDPVGVRFLNKICDVHEGVEIVFSTTWTNYFPMDRTARHWIYSCFMSAGFTGRISNNYRINEDNDPALYGGGRARAIKQYLETYPADDFLILDDNDYGFNSELGIRRFVKTDAVNGILMDHMERAMSIVGQWKI